MNKNVFVFVVCGGANHINTLHFSLKYLRHFSENKIVVVTDSLRNEIDVIHENIIDQRTPQKLNNHQASIYLKTKIHRFLPTGFNYCYLDSDVIAIDKNVDAIFTHYVPPVTFARDHCTIEHFSPSALNCGCQEEANKRQNDFDKLLELYLPGYNKKNQLLKPEYRMLYQELQKLKQQPLKNFRKLINLVFPSTSGNRKKISLNKNYYFDSVQRSWHNADGGYIARDTILGFPKEIKKSGKFRFSRFKNTWVDNQGIPVFKNSCNHLVSEIKNKFSVQITQENWQHWNGGVFLFNDDSHLFLDSWHNNTMDIFSDAMWKIRDQGTLAATVWQYGLEKKELLPEEFNFLADFYNPGLMLKRNHPIEIMNGSRAITPHFLHIYHEFGNENWDLWQVVKAINLDLRND